MRSPVLSRPARCAASPARSSAPWHCAATKLLKPFQCLPPTQGALLLVDASQGIQAQTVANFFLAFELDLSIVPVINKIDMPTADVPSVQEQLRDVLALQPADCVLASAKTGQGLDDVLAAVVERMPCPAGAYLDAYPRPL